jgi:DNA repair protein RecO (recombination protein O)
MPGTQRIERQPAFVLHRRPLRETSLLLDLLTRDHGRVGVVARAARSGTRGLAQACQPFRPLLVAWSGRGELKTLARAELAGSAPAIAGERLYSALYVNEMLVRALATHDSHPAVFDAYARLLPALAQDEVEPRLREFELLLLAELGYALEFRCDAMSGAVLEPAAHYAFAAGHGFVGVDAADASAYPGSILAAIGSGDFSAADTRRYAKRLLREALAPVLGERPLRSREYFRSPRGSKATG